MANVQTDKKGVVDSLKDWWAKPWSNRAWDLSCVFLVLFMSILLTAMILGERFSDSLEAFGLYHPPRGAFADCSRAENSDVRYCNKGRSRISKKSEVGNQVLFSLSK